MHIYIITFNISLHRHTETHNLSTTSGRASVCVNLFICIVSPYYIHIMSCQHVLFYLHVCTCLINWVQPQ